MLSPKSAFLAGLCAAVLLSGCASSTPTGSRARLLHGEPLRVEVVQQPTRMIERGLGISFQTSREELIAQGFARHQSTSDTVEKWSAFRRNKDWGDLNFWDMRSVNRVPATGAITSFQATKGYPKTPDGTQPACSAGFDFALQQARTDNPGLFELPQHEVSRPADGHRLYNVTRLCEGAVANFYGGEEEQKELKGLGRCIVVQCMNIAMGPYSSLLFVTYEDEESDPSPAPGEAFTTSVE